MMKTCKACGGTYRTGAIAYLADDAGKLVASRVCQPCAKRGIVVIPATRAPMCKCGQPATQCHVCASKGATAAKKDAAGVGGAVKVMRGWLKAIDNYAVDDDSPNENKAYADGRIAAIESAIGLLESGRW